MTSPTEISYQWCAGPVPAGCSIAQVYGWLLDRCGRALLLEHGDRVNLPGGGPEPRDGGLVGTLAREALEEAQVGIGDAVYLGYEVETAATGRPRALVRMAALIETIHPRRPDPDGGRLFARRMVPLAGTAAVLGWGASGESQVAAVSRIASTRWGLPTGHGSPGYLG